jgi:hypothetical protein
VPGVNTLPCNAAAFWWTKRKFAAFTQSRGYRATLSR